MAAPMLTVEPIRVGADRGAGGLESGAQALGNNQGAFNWLGHDSREFLATHSADDVARAHAVVCDRREHA